MIKKDIVDRVNEVVDENRTVILGTIDAVFDEMKKALIRGDKIELRGFGVFEVKPRKTGIGRNPKTGDTVVITPGKKVKFKPGKNLSDIK